MADPADQDAVLKALRLGWAMAEARGRLRTGPPKSVGRPNRLEHALPLEDERTWSEQTIEVEAIVAKLAQDLHVDFALHELSGQSGNDTAGSRLQELSMALAKARTADDTNRLRVKWDETCEFIYAWDEKIQDSLAPGSFSVASAYQLGRGLAETFWALDPGATGDDPRSWGFVLGSSRLSQLSRLLTRLADYFPAATAQTVSDSVAAWGEVAADSIVRARPETVSMLHEQIRAWHDALLLEQSLSARVPPRDYLRQARAIAPVLRAFLPEASIGLLGLVAALVAAALFAVGGVNSAVAPVLAILSGFGVTSAGALARAKNEAHSLFAQLQLAMNADVFREELTLEPARAYLDVDGGPVAQRSRSRALKRLRGNDDRGALPRGSEP